MKYHIALADSGNLEITALNAKAGKCPQHPMWDISQILGAEFHQPQGYKVLPIDKICAQIIGRPEYWALARSLSSKLKEDDFIYCDGEHIGIPIATLCGASRARPKIAVLVHNLNRRKGHLALKLFNIASKVDLFVCNISSQAEFLRHYLRLPQSRVYRVPSPPGIDTSFFKPQPASYKKLRPVIGSGGMEQRDYHTLADATKDLDVDVKVCAFFACVDASRRNLPEVLPNNMSCRFYELPDLAQLYCDSDLVVVTLFKNNYEAGMTTIFEAMACRRPVIVTRSSEGTIGELIDKGIVTGVAPGDPIGLKQAIQKLLNNPQLAQTQAERGYELVLKQSNHSQYVRDLVTKISSTFE